MLNAQPMLKALGEIEAAARVRDEALARDVLTRVRTTWAALRARLDSEAARGG
jgi:hypothetical protein